MLCLVQTRESGSCVFPNMVTKCKGGTSQVCSNLWGVQRTFTYLVSWDHHNNPVRWARWGALNPF